MNVIENWYDNMYDEWSRLDRHRIEFEITKRYLDANIKDKSLKILDIGGGPGRYSFYLAGKGHHVTLLDLSRHNIEVALEKSEELGIMLDGCIKGDALDLSAFSEEEYDVILLMGPLYHLTREEDRQKAVSEALRLLKQGGLLITSFISKYAPINEALMYLDFSDKEDQVKKLLHYLEDGINEGNDGFTQAYFTGVEEAQSLMTGFGLKQLAFAGMESALGYKEEEVIKLPADEFNKCIDILLDEFFFNMLPVNWGYNNRV
jgi:ubiquinone/menaquinone biosynthesis C-methylase UbiE